MCLIILTPQTFSCHTPQSWMRKRDEAVVRVTTGFCFHGCVRWTRCSGERFIFLANHKNNQYTGELSGAKKKEKKKKEKKKKEAVISVSHIITNILVFICIFVLFPSPITPLPWPLMHPLFIRFAVLSTLLGAGIAQWLERRTRDWKVAGSNPCWNGGRIFFSRVDFLRWLLFRYPFHPRVTTVARKKSRSFCQKCRWQVTAKHAYTLRMWLLLNRASALVTTCP